MNRITRCALAAWAAFVLAAQPAAAQPAMPLNIVDFASSSSLALYVCMDKGFCDAAGAPVRLTHTPSAAAQMNGLITGQIDIALTLIDNVFAYQAGQAELPPGAVPALIAVMGLTYTRVDIVARPGLTSFAALRDQAIGVDNLATGLALMLVDQLQREGLQPGDYRLVSIGGIAARAEAMQSGRVAGAALSAPYFAQAIARGFHHLQPSDAGRARYEGQVVAVQRAWALANEARLRGFLAAMVRSQAWLAGPAHAAEAAAILRAQLPGASEAEASAAVAQMLATGFHLSPEVDLEAAGRVLEVRRAHGMPRRDIPPIQSVVDASYLPAGR